MFDKKLWEQAQQLARQNYSELYDEDWNELDKYEREDYVFTEYEKLKEKLAKEGLFNEDRKRKLLIP